MSWAQSDYSATYTSNITLSTDGGIKAEACKVIINQTEYDGIKIGTGSAVGSMTMTIPQGTKYLHLHVSGWTGVSNLSLVVSGIDHDNIPVNADAGVANNSPFTLQEDPSTSNYYKVITFTDPLENDTELTLTTSGKKRCVIFGVNSEANSSNPSIAADNVALDYDATEGAISYTINNPATDGVLTAEVTEGSWLTLGTVGETVPFTATANDGAERTATVKLTYTYNTDETVTKDVTITQAAASSVDYATLPFTWNGGSSSDFLALNGVTGNCLGGDYAASNNPYLIKFDGTGDYIQIKTDSQPGKVTIGVKMIGGSNTSTITVQGSSDGETFTDVEELTISGAQNAVLTLETSSPFDANDRYVKLVFTKGSNVGVGPITIAVANTTDPQIVAEAMVELAYDATSGEIPYTINNPVAGTTLTAATTAEWVSNVTVASDKVTFTATVNDGAERTATVTLTYGTLTKEVTVTQAGNPSMIMTIAQVRAQGTGSVKTKGIVTSCVGTTGYIQDATAAICVYGKALTVGDEITVEGTLTTYNGLLEITSPEFEVLSSGNTVTPEVMTIAEINASTNQGWLVKIEDATVTVIDGQNTTIAQGQNTIVVRGISGVEYEVGDVLTLTGNIGCYNTTQIANPTNVTVTAGVALEAVSDKMWTFEDWENGDITTTTIIDNLQVNAASDKKITIDENEKSIDGYTFTKRLKFNGGGNASSRNVHFKVVGNSKITVYGMSGSSSATRKIDINIGNSVVAQLTNDGTAIGKVEYIYSGEEETDVYVYSDNSGNNIYGIKVEPYSSTTPSITVEETEISVGADEADGTIAVTYNNITEVNANVYFCDADGEEADYDWIVAEINDENNIEYLVDANDGAERKAYLKVYALDDEENEVYSELITFTQAAYVAPPTPVDGKYVKVTSTDDITDGQYLIVYEEGAVAFDGGLTTLDAVGNTIEVVIENEEISATTATRAAEFTIDVTAGTLQSASGKYIGVSSNSNGLKTSDDAETYTNAFSIDDNENAVIAAVFEGSSMTLRFNASSNQDRFRYYSSGQKAIQLYKFVSSNTVTASVSQYKWATFSSEYDLDFTDVTAVEAHIVTGANGSTIVTEKVEGTVAAGTGLLLYSETLVENVEIPVAEEAGVNYSNMNKLIAVVEDETVINKAESGFTNYVLAVQGGKAVFAYIDEVPATLNKGKAYLMLEGDAPAPFLGFEGGGTTAITDIQRSTLNTQPIYDLSGRRVENPSNGVYIVNGKKVVIK